MRVLLAAAFALTALLAAGVVLAMGIGGLNDTSWQLAYSPSEVRPLDETVIYVADVDRGLIHPFQPRGATAAMRGGIAQGQALALSPDRHFMVESRIAERAQMTIVRVATGRAYVIGAGDAPVWSPDSRYVSFARRSQMYVVRLVQGIPATPVRVSGLRAIGSNTGVWSPDSELLALELTRIGGSDIHTVRPDGSALTNLTSTDWTNEMHPAWSPDGTRIAYTADPLDSGRAIYVMDRDGSNRRLLAEAPSGGFPAWSPDGTHIAYLSASGSTIVLLVVPVDAQGEAVALTPVEFSARPVWSPDGRSLAYYGAAEPLPTIHVIDIRTRVTYPLTQTFNVMLP